MKWLAIIPARGGSVRFPGKNLAVIHGRSLVAWAVWHGAPCDLTVVSTDDDYIAVEGITQGAHAHKRLPHLATATAQMTPVVMDVLEDLSQRAPLPDAIMLLQPTSPLRTQADVKAVQAMFEFRSVDAVISVTKVRHPELFHVGHAGRMRPAPSGSDALYAPNGAIFAARTEVLMAGKDWWSAECCYAYEMPEDRSVDIDTAADLDMAARLWR